MAVAPIVLATLNAARPALPVIAGVAKFAGTVIGAYALTGVGMAVGLHAYDKTSRKIGSRFLLDGRPSVKAEDETTIAQGATTAPAAPPAPDAQKTPLAAFFPGTYQG